LQEKVEAAMGGDVEEEEEDERSDGKESNQPELHPRAARRRSPMTRRKVGS
jgi:hypothetical protein